MVHNVEVRSGWVQRGAIVKRGRSLLVVGPEKRQVALNPTCSHDCAFASVLRDIYCGVHALLIRNLRRTSRARVGHDALLVAKAGLERCLCHLAMLDLVVMLG
jgi:hypothetical protein